MINHVVHTLKEQRNTDSAKLFSEGKIIMQKGKCHNFETRNLSRHVYFTGNLFVYSQSTLYY